MLGFKPFLGNSTAIPRKPSPDLLCLLMKKLSKDDFETWCVMVWMIWKERIFVVHGKPGREPLVLLEDIKGWLSKFKRLYSPELPKVCSRLHMGWPLPSPGSLKLNVDAAVDTFSRLIGIGAIIRDGIGAVVATLFTGNMGHFGAFFAECMVVREGLKFSWEEGHNVNLVKCDSLNVIKAIHSRCSLGIKSSIINDIVVNFS
ncbi:Ribonuclease H-like domain containing protein [Parasponia andersonii]|uniref:Ribonuclease H-like domain containing protein n=1 Tax=Parasponia andersonii TaxID=3476 RepID=A0A2P5A5K8_PARAD|nr:Ribonuclease H-like domain containing protein [Parasponia andersonii]